MKKLLQKGLSKLSLCIATAIILAVIIFAGAYSASPAFSYAESEKISYSLSSHYVSFGEILCFDVSENGSIALIEKDNDDYYFRLLSREGEELHKESINLSEGIEPQLASFDNKVIIYNENVEDSDGYLKVFDVEQKSIYSSDIKIVRTLTDEDISISYPFKSFIADEKQGLLIVNYGISLFWYESKGLTRIKSINSSEVFDKSDKSFDIIEVAKESQNQSRLYLAEDSENSTAVMDFYLTYSYQEDRAEPFSWIKKKKEGEIESLTRFNGKIYYDAFAEGITLTERGIEGLTSELLIPFGANDDNIRNVQMFKEQNGELFVADNGQGAIKVFNEEGTLVEMLATYGNGTGDSTKGLLRFNSPSLISVSDSYIAVYDKGNSRVLLLDKDFNVTINQPIEGEVQSVAICNGTLVYAINSSIFTVTEQGEEPLQYDFNEKILSLCYDGTRLTAFTKNTCYLYGGISFTPIISEINTWGEGLFEKERDYSKIIGGKHDGILYLIDDLNHCATMYKNYSEVIKLNNLPEHESISSDIKGNLWILNGGKVYAYNQVLDSYTLTEYSLDATFSCLRITNSGNAYAITGHSIASLELQTAKEESGVEEIEEYDYPCSSIELSSGAWGYQNPDNFENVIYLSGNAKYPLFKTITYNEKAYYYTELCENGKYIKAFLPISHGEKVEMEESDNEYVKYSGIDRTPKGYAYPSNTAPSVIDIERGIGYKVLGIISLTAEGLGNDWYLLEYDNQTFYVKKEGYVKDENPLVEIERYFARAKTTTSGGKIYIYATPSLEGEIIDWVTDGNKIELTEKFDSTSEFSEIRYNDKIAYILSSNVQENGLTAGQTFAIIFSIIIVGVTASLLVIAKIAKQRRGKK